MYSLVLLLLIPLTIFLNTFYILSHFQKNIDTVTHSKAILAENIIGLFARDSINDPERLSHIIEKVLEENKEIAQFEFLVPNFSKGNFTVLASSEASDVGKESQEVHNALAWNQEEGIAFLGANGENRAWKVTKVIRDQKGEKTGLVSLAFSLKDSDNLINSTIDRSYLALIFTIIIVFLMVANNSRLFGYMLTVTKLQELDKIKDNFISMASHEIRSPLASIRGYVEFLKEKNEEGLTEESRRYLDNIDFSVKRLDFLVNDILEISRIEGNRVPFNIADFDPSFILKESVEEIMPQASGKGLSVKYDFASLPLVKADKDRVKQVLANLLSNSVKYTLKGHIEIKTEQKGRELCITIADTGIGISAEDQTKVFEKFYRIKEEQTKNVTGTGLGLWITRELARKMGGDVTMESIKNVGSHFTVHLPLAG